MSGNTVLSRACAFAGVIMGLVVLTALPASAHAEEEAGGVAIVVGWGVEPGYAGFQNSVTAEITNSATGEPVTDVTDTLQVEVSTGEQSEMFEMGPDFVVGEFGTPGVYSASLIPTRPGTYTFRFTGTIQGQPVDLSVTSGEDTFDDIDNPADIQFPAKDPTIGDVATKVDALDGRVQTAADNATTAADAAQNAKDDASTTQTIAIIALVVGAIGVVLGGVSLARKRQ